MCKLGLKRGYGKSSIDPDHSWRNPLISVFWRLSSQFSPPEWPGRDPGTGRTGSLSAAHVWGGDHPTSHVFQSNWRGFVNHPKYQDSQWGKALQLWYELHSEWEWWRITWFVAWFYQNYYCISSHGSYHIPINIPIDPNKSHYVWVKPCHILVNIYSGYHSQWNNRSWHRLSIVLPNL